MVGWKSKSGPFSCAINWKMSSGSSPSNSALVGVASPDREGDGAGVGCSKNRLKMYTWFPALTARDPPAIQTESLIGTEVYLRMSTWRNGAQPGVTST